MAHRSTPGEFVPTLLSLLVLTLAFKTYVDINVQTLEPRPHGLLLKFKRPSLLATGNKNVNAFRCRNPPVPATPY